MSYSNYVFVSYGVTVFVLVALSVASLLAFARQKQKEMTRRSASEN